MSDINIEAEFADIMDDYSAEVTGATREAIKEVAKEATKKLRQVSPRRKGGGAYAKGWTHKVEEGAVTTSATVYGGKKTYPLAHLLEHGHAKRGGGRTDPIDHIKPVEDWAVEELQKRIKEKVESL